MRDGTDLSPMAKDNIGIAGMVAKSFIKKRGITKIEDTEEFADAWDTLRANIFLAVISCLNTHYNLE